MRVSQLFSFILTLSLIPAGPSAATPDDQPIVVLTVASIDSALDDIEAMGAFQDPAIERELLLRKMMQPINFPLGDWLDRSRKAHLVSFPTDASTNGAKSRNIQPTLVLPVLSAADALRAFVVSPSEPDEDGVHTIEREGEPRWFLRFENESMAVSLERKRVFVDHARLAALGCPAGNIGFEWNFDLIASLEEESRDDRQQSTTALFEDLIPDKQAMFDSMRKARESHISLLRDLPTARACLEVSDDKVIVHARALMAENGKLAASMRKQPSEFPRLARFFDDEPSFLTIVGNLPLDNELWPAASTLRFPDLDPSVAKIRQCLRGDVAAMAKHGEEGYLQAVLLAELDPTPACRKVAEATNAVPMTNPDDVYYASAFGPGSTQKLTEGIDRLNDGFDNGTMIRKTFAPIGTGAGLYAVIDLSHAHAFVAYMGWRDRIAAGDVDQRILFGVRAESEYLSATLIVPAWLVSWAAMENALHDPLIPRDLWPPPPAPATQLARLELPASDPRSSDGQDVSDPKNVHRTGPVYPEILRKSWLEGRVLIRVVVTKEGTTRDFETMRCHGKNRRDDDERKNLDVDSPFCRMLSDAAIAAAESWRYEPARENGKAVDVYITIAVNYTLE